MSIKINHTLIILLVLIALGLLSACSNTIPAATSSNESPVPPDRVDVVYFYKEINCHCQGAVGDQITSTIFFNFSEELNNGKLTFQSLDLENEESAIIASKYHATPMSMFMNIVTADTEHIIAVPEISLLKDDEDALDKLVNTRIRQALDGKK